MRAKGEKLIDAMGTGGRGYEEREVCLVGWKDLSRGEGGRCGGVGERDRGRLIHVFGVYSRRGRKQPQLIARSDVCGIRVSLKRAVKFRYFQVRVQNNLSKFGLDQIFNWCSSF